MRPTSANLLVVGALSADDTRARKLGGRTESCACASLGECPLSYTLNLLAEPRRRGAPQQPRVATWMTQKPRAH